MIDKINETDAILISSKEQREAQSNNYEEGEHGQHYRSHIRWKDNNRYNEQLYANKLTT